MNKFIVSAIMLVLVLSLIAACSSAPTPAPTAPAPTQAAPAVVPPVAAPTNPPPPTAQATAVPPTAVPPTAVPPTAAPSATPAPPTAAPSNTPTPPPTVQPGLYVSALRLTPAQPAFNQNIAFAPTFVNATGTVQNFTWKVYIWRADTVTKTDNETSAQLTAFPAGVSSFTSLGSYRYGATGYQCEYFFARVGWLDANNKVTYFTKPDGTDFNQGFKICDINIIPTNVPPTAASTAVPPTPGPGLFVTNLRLQPSGTPQHFMPTTFFATFQNTTTTVQNFTWRVYIYRADTPNKSNIETTNLLTAFPVGTEEVQSLGTFTYGATGNPCDYFFARVGWIDANNKITFFTTPDGQVYQKGFQVCN